LIKGLHTSLRVSSSQRHDCPIEIWRHSGTSNLLFTELKVAFLSDTTGVNSQ